MELIWILISPMRQTIWQNYQMSAKIQTKSYKILSSTTLLAQETVYRDIQWKDKSSLNYFASQSTVICCLDHIRKNKHKRKKKEWERGVGGRKFSAGLIFVVFSRVKEVDIGALWIPVSTPIQRLPPQAICVKVIVLLVLCLFGIPGLDKHGAWKDI